jgi:S1-C subfamily serine protease
MQFLDKSTVIMESRKNTGAILTRNFIADAVEKASPAVVNVAVDSGAE